MLSPMDLGFRTVTMRHDMMCVYINDQDLVSSVAFNFKEKHILENN